MLPFNNRIYAKKTNQSTTPKNHKFYGPSVVDAQCVIRVENIQMQKQKTCICANDEFSQALGAIVSCFRHLAEGNNLQP